MPSTKVVKKGRYATPYHKQNINKNARLWRIWLVAKTYPTLAKKCSPARCQRGNHHNPNQWVKPTIGKRVTKVCKNGKLHPKRHNRVGNGVWQTITNIHYQYVNGFGTGQFYSSHSHNRYWVPMACTLQCNGTYNYCRWPYCKFLTGGKQWQSLT